MLDNQNPGGRYDDKELAEHTKSLRNTADIKLPTLSKKEDYQAWFSEAPFTSGAACWARSRTARKVKAFSALALSLSVDLRTTFKIDSIRDKMEAPPLLSQRITEHFEAGDGVNPNYLRRELMNQQLQSKEAVTKGLCLSQGTTKVDHEWIHLCQGITIKTATLSHDDAKDLKRDRMTEDCTEVNDKDLEMCTEVYVNEDTRLCLVEKSGENQ
ncbi:hypothetical protein PC128_g12411 [Phytophthora cactorum]|nr:hypothetical protein PC128_g12411 [Phytophthora cactorum]